MNALSRIEPDLVRIEPGIESLLKQSAIHRVDRSDYPCASITLDSAGITLIINHRKFINLFDDEKIAVIAHEYAHFSLGHLSTRLFDDTDRYIVGVAQDLSINSILRSRHRLPKWFITPERVGLPEGLSTGKYIRKLESMNLDKIKSVIKIPESKLDHSILAQNQVTEKEVLLKTKL